MKTLPLSIILISLLMLGCMSNVSGMLPSSDNEIQLLTGKPTYVPGEKIQIIGAFQPNDLIHIDLVNPLDGTKNSTLLQSDPMGHFRTNYIVPYDAVNGTWKILATSGLSHASLDIQVISSNHGLKNKNTDGSVGSVTATPILSPLKQIDRGIPTENIVCSNDLELVYKTSNNYPACVKHATVEKLVQRGWAIRGQPVSYFVKSGGFLIQYDLIGGNMINMTSDTQNKSIIFSVHATSSGVFYVKIPRILLDSKSAYSNQDTKFIVLVDKQEVKYTETTSITERTLSIPFDLGAKQIEIIATMGI